MGELGDFDLMAVPFAAMAIILQIVDLVVHYYADFAPVLHISANIVFIVCILLQQYSVGAFIYVCFIGVYLWVHGEEKFVLMGVERSAVKVTLGVFAMTFLLMFNVSSQVRYRERLKME